MSNETNVETNNKKSSLINRSAVKKMALRLSEDTRNGTFTRVGSSFIDRIEYKLEAIIRSEVHQHPSTGKTLM